MDASTGTGAPLALSLSNDGLFAAHVHGKDLAVYSDLASEHKEMQIAKAMETSVKSLKFSPTRNSIKSCTDRRLLSSNESRISVFQLEELKLFAEIENLEPGTLNIEFGADENEILVFHAWNTKMTIHSLDTGCSSMIKSPKSAHHLGFGYRPHTLHFAILLKPDTSDLLTIHDPQTYNLVSRVVLSTNDAQGLKWSPDGRWIAVWDAASSGTKVLIFTADGQLFRTYSGPSEMDDSFDLGVKQIEWSPVGKDGTSSTLAVGKVNGNVDLLRTRTFTCSTTLSHVFPLDQSSPRIWRERYTSALGDAEYAEATCSSAFNMSPESSGPPRGVQIMAFSPDGTMLATVDTMRSNVVWIWALDATPRLASALVHEQPVRQLAWHPSTPQLLINAITNNLPTIRWWSPNDHPVIARVPTQKSDSGKYEVKWLVESENDATFWFASTEEYVVGYLTDENGISGFEVLNSVTSRGYGGHAGSLSR
ncbi:hypothetical protein N7509_011666 [Penicillium cosmopolitanum]|uniref:Uncharacterized protein n=1 Tax=Penicillium cosmopolitanum TaxID=1131564 RepID=A0A9W9SH61_9EURO|nr:uncharacterized protein N7509_011666 [Penicillium cosmopolitanum]KAJ5378547.1 hypothetical protein N7509_011666 [Penicillium cosmopolitanum]